MDEFVRYTNHLHYDLDSNSVFGHSFFCALDQFGTFMVDPQMD